MNIFISALAILTISLISYATGILAAQDNESNFTKCKFCRKDHIKQSHEDIEGWKIK